MKLLYLLAVALCISQSLKSQDKDKPSKDRPSRDLTHGFEGTTVTRETTRERPARETSPGNVGSNKEGASNGSTGNRSQVEASKVVSVESLEALKKIQQLKSNWAFIKKLALGYKIASLLTSPSEMALDQMKNILTEDWKEFAEGLRTMSDAEKAQINHLVTNEAFNAAERANEANRNNTPDKEARKIEENFWSKWAEAASYRVSEPVGSGWYKTKIYKKPSSIDDVKVEGLDFDVWDGPGWNNEKSLVFKPFFTITNLHYNFVEVKLQLSVPEEGNWRLWTGFQGLMQSKSGSYNVNYETVSGFIDYTMPTASVAYTQLPEGKHSMEVTISVIVENVVKGKETYSIQYER